MPKSSAFNLIQTLLDRGFIYETRKRGGYYPTRRLLELASRIAEGDPFLQNIHGYLESLAAETGETALLAVREHAAVIYVDVVRSEEHTSELQSLMRISYAVFCLKKKKQCMNLAFMPSTTRTIDHIAYLVWTNL